jgi:protein involved in polysaccharide export with SLBB domain
MFYCSISPSETVGSKNKMRTNMALLKLSFLVLLFVVLAPLALSRASISDSAKAYVLACGEVNKPGMIPFTEGMTLRHALVLFEGMTVRADVSRVLILGKDGRRIPIDTATLSGTNDEELQAGDVIAVPTLGKQHFFAMGEVNTAGVFEYREGMTLTQAAVLFGGPTSLASLARTLIVRKDQVGGRHKVIQVDLRAVMEGKTEDVAILANDVIFIREFGVASKP